VGNITAPVRGLVSLLELTTEGRVPDSIAGTVQGVINVEPFVQLGKRERLQFAATAAGTTNGPWAFSAGVVNGTVPQNEAWLLLAYTVQALHGVGERYAFQPAVQMFVSGGGGTSRQVFTLGQKQSVDNATLAGQLYAPASQVPLLLPPSSILGGVTSDLSAAFVINANGWADIVRIRV